MQKVCNGRGEWMERFKLRSTVMLFWVIFATYKIAFKLKETWNSKFTETEKHRRDNNNKTQKNNDG